MNENVFMVRKESTENSACSQLETSYCLVSVA